MILGGPSVPHSRPFVRCQQFLNGEGGKDSKWVTRIKGISHQIDGFFSFLSSDFRGNNRACAACTKCVESRRKGREEAKKWVKRTTSVFCLFLLLCFSSHFFSESKTRGEKKNTRGANFLSNGFFCCWHTRFPNWGAKMCTTPPQKGVIFKMAGGHRPNIYSRREKTTVHENWRVVSPERS